MLDPTCGSDQMLLGEFDQWIKLWQKHEPGEAPREIAQHATESVNRLDLNSNITSIYHPSPRQRQKVGVQRASLTSV